MRSQSKRTDGEEGFAADAADDGVGLGDGEVAMGAIVERPSEGSLLHRHAVAAHLQRDRGAMLADLLRDGVERDTLVQSVLNDQPVINCALVVMGLFLVLVHGRTPF